MLLGTWQWKAHLKAMSLRFSIKPNRNISVLMSRTQHWTITWLKNSPSEPLTRSMSRSMAQRGQGWRLHAQLKIISGWKSKDPTEPSLDSCSISALMWGCESNSALDTGTQAGKVLGRGGMWHSDTVFTAVSSEGKLPKKFSYGCCHLPTSPLFS